MDPILSYVSGISYFAWIGTFNLIILTWQDFRNKMMIDDRKNFLMLGVAFSLISHITRPSWYILVLLGVMFGFAYFSKKSKELGAGDIHCLTWIFMGLAIINPIYLLVFISLFIPVTLGFAWIKNKVAGDKPLPFFGVILIMFVFFCWIWGIY